MTLASSPESDDRQKLSEGPVDLETKYFWLVLKGFIDQDGHTLDPLVTMALYYAGLEMYKEFEDRRLLAPSHTIRHEYPLLAAWTGCVGAPAASSSDRVYTGDINYLQNLMEE